LFSTVSGLVSGFPVCWLTDVHIRKWKLRERPLRERVLLDSSDGEPEFDQKMLNRRRKKVLDVGCGPGEFTPRVAKGTKSVTEIDASRVARGRLIVM